MRTTMLMRFCLLGWFALGFISSVRAQDPGAPPEATVTEVRPGGMYSVRIGNEVLLAIPMEVAQKALSAQSKIDAQDARILEMQALIDTCDATVTKHKEALEAQAQLLDETKSLSEEYRALAKGYRQSTQPKWFSLDAGIGATGDSNPVATVGVGVRRFRIWGFFQESNSGAMIGVNLPLF